MKSILLVFFCSFFSLPFLVTAQTQTYTIHGGRKTKTLIPYEIPKKDPFSKFKNAVYTLVGDTLFTNKDFKIFVGQKLFVGNGTSDNGCFKTIFLNSEIDWFSIDIAINVTQNPETPEERWLRMITSLREYLHKEGSLYVKEIKKIGNARSGYWFTLILHSKPGIRSTHYRCNIQEALKTGEIILPND